MCFLCPWSTLRTDDVRCHVNITGVTVTLFPDDQIWSGTSTRMSLVSIWLRTSCQRRWRSSFSIKAPTSRWCCLSTAPLGQERRWSAPCWEIICTAQPWAARTSTSLSPPFTSLYPSGSVGTRWVIDASVIEIILSLEMFSSQISLDYFPPLVNRKSWRTGFRETWRSALARSSFLMRWRRCLQASSMCWSPSWVPPMLCFVPTIARPSMSSSGTKHSLKLNS